MIVTQVYDDEFGVEVKQQSVVDVQSSTDMRHYNLKHLLPDSRYELVIKAHNEVGWSENSSTFVFQTAPGT